MSSILVKFPTRGRPEKFFDTLDAYRGLESGLHSVRYLVTCDLNDGAMNNSPVFERLSHYPRLAFNYGNNPSKVAACNADMHLAPDGWEVLILASDDMVPEVKGWDDRVAQEMKGRDAVWFFDGYVRAICTLSIMSRALYERQGYIYHPDYKSVFCDNEWTDVAKPVFVDEVIIRHRHPMNGHGPVDELLKANEAWYFRDQATYKKRKNASFPRECLTNSGNPGPSNGTPKIRYSWGGSENRSEDVILSVCICSLKNRSELLAELVRHLESQIHTADLEGKVEVLTEVDEGGMTIGEKRNILVGRAAGRYICFVDDDDRVSDDYVALLAGACSKNPDCVGICGRIWWHGVWKPFEASTRYARWFETEQGFFRTPNHLNPIRKNIVKKFRFPHKYNGEDADYSTRILKSKTLKTEEFVAKCVYDYLPAGTDVSGVREQIVQRNPKSGPSPHRDKRARSLPPPPVIPLEPITVPESPVVEGPPIEEPSPLPTVPERSQAPAVVLLEPITVPESPVVEEPPIEEPSPLPTVPERSQAPAEDVVLPKPVQPVTPLPQVNSNRKTLGRTLGRPRVHLRKAEH